MRTPARGHTCTAPGCTREVLARELCSAHYQRWVKRKRRERGDRGNDGYLKWLKWVTT